MLCKRGGIMHLRKVSTHEKCRRMTICADRPGCHALKISAVFNFSCMLQNNFTSYFSQCYLNSDLWIYNCVKSCLKKRMADIHLVSFRQSIVNLSMGESNTIVSSNIYAVTIVLHSSIGWSYNIRYEPFVPSCWLLALTTDRYLGLHY